MIRSLIHSILIWIVTLGVAGADDASKALQYLNTLRFKSGLVKFEPSQALQKAARAHARYLIKHQDGGHYESVGKSGFTGTTPSERVLAAGYFSKAVMENVSVNTDTPEESIDTLMAAIYHRLIFLNFEKDEIGIAQASKKEKKGFFSASVYDLGSKKANALCKEHHMMQSGVYYLQNICKDSQKCIPQYLYLDQEAQVRKKNNPVVHYPYEGQQNVQPAFFEESPDPLPGYKVSGFPISIQFNPAYYHQVDLKRFELFDSNSHQSKKIIINEKNDIHHRFSSLQFALMPLQRLEYGMDYRVIFEAVVDGKPFKKVWSFSTLKPKGKLYKITQNKSRIEVKKGEKVVLYFEPKHKKDVLDCVTHTRGMKIECIDQNTLAITLPEDFEDRTDTLITGNRSVMLLID
ncbi:MAG: CAP domain-containing protein [Campylobacterales bacterium]|nr:CAP domain-containing protein [Campylobacterales bacterium]